MMNLVVAEPLFHCDPEIEAVVRARRCPAVGLRRVNRTKKTSFMALKKGSGSTSTLLRSCKCMCPSPSGMRAHRYFDSVGSARAAVNTSKLTSTHSNFDQTFTSSEEQNAQNHDSFHVEFFRG